MKKVVLFLCALLWFTQLVQSQPKQKAEKEFLKELNSILSNSKDTDFWHEKGTMTVDSKFTISDKGILSVTVKYTEEDATFTRVRMEAAVSKIIDVAYDHYLILEFKDDDVTFYESEVSSYVSSFTTLLFSISSLNFFVKLSETKKFRLDIG
jgi:hypothetical protein